MKSIIKSLILVVFLTTPALSKEIVNYHVIIHTADKYGAGTDNNLQIKLHGAAVDSGWKTVQGNQEQNQTENFNIMTEDVGIIYAVRFRMTTRLADDWEVGSVQVYRKVDRKDPDNADGWSEFIANRVISAWGGDVYLPATKRVQRVTITPSGHPVVHEDTITLVQFGYNPHTSQSQEVMRYTETWSDVETVSFSKSKSNDVGASLTLGYESPESVAGTFSAEASVSWSKTIAEERSNGTEKTKESAYDWSYTAPPATAVFRKVTFKIPYASQLYKASNSKDSRIVRKLNGKIVPTGLDEFLFIGKGQQVADWKTVEDDWLKYAHPTTQEAVRKYKNQWAREKWIKNPSAIAEKNTKQVPTVRKPPPVKKDPQSMDYEVTIVTGRSGDGGTDANVQIQIVGKKRGSGWVKLNTLKSGNIFEAGDTDRFRLTNQFFVGEITGVRIHFDDSYAGSDWRLYSIEVKELGGDRHKFKKIPNVDLRNERTYTF